MKYKAIAYNGEVVKGDDIIWRGMTMYIVGKQNGCSYETAVDPASVKEVKE